MARASAGEQGQVLRHLGLQHHVLRRRHARYVRMHLQFCMQLTSALCSCTHALVSAAEFVYKNDSVLRVSKAGYYHCNETAGDAAPRDGRTVFLLDAPGYAYFASADVQHCGMGERLAVSVLAATPSLPAPAPSPSSPWSSSAPGPWSWVLSPSSSAPSPSGEHSAAAALLVASSSAQAVALALAMAAGFV